MQAEPKLYAAQHPSLSVVPLSLRTRIPAERPMVEPLAVGPLVVEPSAVEPSMAVDPIQTTLQPLEVSSAELAAVAPSELAS